MKHLTISLFALSLFPIPYSLSAAVPLRWTVETSLAKPETFDEFAGATYDLEATLQSYGKPLAVVGEPHLYWQTNGMGSAYWTAPATVSGNVLRATWTPACDVGARTYNCFIGITGTVYNAAFQLRLRPSPGAVPNELPLPQKVIDFSQVTVLNPPWSGGGGSGGVDTNAVIDIANATIATNAIVSGKRDQTDEAAYDHVTNSVFEVVGWYREQLGDGEYGERHDVNLSLPWSQEIVDNGYGYDSDIIDATEAYSDGTVTVILMGERAIGPGSGWWYYIGLPYDTSPFFPEVPANIYDDYGYSLDLNFSKVQKEEDAPSTTQKLARRAIGAASALAKFDADGNLVADNSGKGLSSNDYTDDDKAEVAKVKDKADEFTEWVPGAGAPDTLIGQPRYNDTFGFFVWNEPLGINYRTYQCEKDELSVEFYRSDSHPGEHSFHATRKRVLRTGDAATTNDLTAAISTNNPAFVSAVQSIAPSSPPSLRLYDAARDCWWIGRMVNGIISWEVEE